MTFHSLLLQHNWQDIRGVFFTLYPDGEEDSAYGYFAAYRELQGTAPTSSDMTLCIETVEDYENVYATEAGDETHYAIDFVPWAQVLSMPVAEKTLKKYSELEIISHLLYEITFYGYSAEAVAEKNTELHGALDEVLDGLPK